FLAMSMIGEGQNDSGISVSLLIFSGRLRGLSKQSGAERRCYVLSACLLIRSLARFSRLISSLLYRFPFFTRSHLLTEPVGRVALTHSHTLTHTHTHTLSPQCTSQT